MKNRRLVQIVVVFITLIFVLSCKTNEKKYESSSYKRFKESKLRYEKFNEFETQISYTKLTGIGFEEGVTRRDPSSVIKVDDLYYVWYTRPPAGIPVVGYDKANDTLRAYHWDLAEIWYATSPDGYNWTEKGVAVTRGPKGNYDHRSVFTTDIMVANGKYYLFYQAAESLKQGHKGQKHPVFGGDFIGNVIGMSWADSPNGPWHRAEKPILEVGKPEEWDSNVMHDPSLIVRNGKYWLYYKSSPRLPWDHQEKSTDPMARKFADLHRAVIGVAIADKPEGPYIKSKYNPVIVGGHETIVWPYRNGVCAYISEGPEARSIQFAEDGINFYPVAHGVPLIEAAGTYRVGNFTDTDMAPGQGVTWGICHKLGEWNFLERFDCDLSLEKGNEKKAEFDKMIEWSKSNKDWKE